MKGENVNCNATNCLYNFSRECKAGSINVDGQSAMSTSGTTCTTFVDKSQSSFVNSVDHSDTYTGNIRCEAYNCVYNKDKDCHAEKVEIDAQNARCNTFKCD